VAAAPLTETSPRNVSKIAGQLGLPDLRSESGKMPAKINLEVTSFTKTYPS